MLTFFLCAITQSKFGSNSLLHSWMWEKKVYFFENEKKKQFDFGSLVVKDKYCFSKRAFSCFISQRRHAAQTVNTLLCFCSRRAARELRGGVTLVFCLRDLISFWARFKI